MVIECCERAINLPIDTVFVLRITGWKLSQLQIIRVLLWLVNVALNR